MCGGVRFNWKLARFLWSVGTALRGGGGCEEEKGSMKDQVREGFLGRKRKKSIDEQKVRGWRRFANDPYVGGRVGQKRGMTSVDGAAAEPGGILAPFSPPSTVVYFFKSFRVYKFYSAVGCASGCGCGVSVRRGLVYIDAVTGKRLF